MADVAVRTEGLGKQYRIGTRDAAYRTLREAVVDTWLAAVRGLRQGRRPRSDTFWALQDVTLEIKHGEAVGLIGRNGAGKSTLLKILARITGPSVGAAHVRGRLSSLLEVGTGFHAELTGRENIFLNGAILGMRRAEIAAKLDAIVEFAELERFVDTPVKHYSSGMYLRLAFAVAAHLDTEILLVDEVLAVGDARFQKRCLNRMHASAQEGRTVLFVSHDMPAVARLCERVVLLDGGRVVADGPPAPVITTYLTSGLGTTAAREWPDPERAPRGELVRLHAVRVRDAGGAVSATIDIRRDFSIEMEWEALEGGHMVLPWLTFTNENGIEVFGPHDIDPEWRRRRRPAGRYVTAVAIPGNLLTEGTLFVSVACETVEPKEKQFVERDAIAFQIVDSMEGDSARGDYEGPIGGVVRPKLRWTTRFTPRAPGQVP